MKTLRELVDYVHDYMSKNDASEDIIEKDVMYDMIQEELLDIVEEALSQEDMDNWVRSGNDEHLDEVLNERLEDYPGLLEEIKNDIIKEYSTEK